MALEVGSGSSAALPSDGAVSSVIPEGGVIDFKIGTLRGVWHSDDTGDYIITLSFHAMTFEDVVLLFATFLPIWSLLCYLLFERLPECWSAWGDKAEADELGRDSILDDVADVLGTPGGGTLGGVAGAPAAAGDDDDDEEAANNGSFHKRRYSGGVTRPSREGKGAAAPPTCRTWLVGLLPVQLRPRAVYARASSIARRAKAAPLETFWGGLSSLVYNLLCCACCSAIFGKITGSAPKKRHLSVSGKMYGTNGNGLNDGYDALSS